MLGKRLKLLRKAKGIPQRELAEIIGVRKSVISLYETDKNDPSDKMKVKLAKYFDVSLDYLCGIIDENVKYYNDNNFVELPENVTEEEKQFIKKFMDYILFLREK